MAGTYGRSMWKRDVSGDDPTFAEEWTSRRPMRYELREPYPNPVRTGSSIEFTVPVPEHVRLSVLDVRGRVVACLVDASMDAGTHRVQLEPSSLSPGIYFCRMEAGGFSGSKKFVLAR